MQKVIGRKARPAPGRGGKPGISRAQAFAAGIFTREYELQHIIASFALQGLSLEASGNRVKQMIDVIVNNMRMEAEKVSHGDETEAA